MKSLIAALAALSAVACTGLRYNSLPVDSAPPPEAGALARCPAQLALGAKPCVALVQADQWASPTGIMAGGADENYCLTVPPNQVWFDADRRNTPPFGEKGSWLMNLAPKRHKEVGFFALMVDVQRPGEALSESRTALPVDKPLGFLYRTKYAGALVLYPNDAMGPSNAPDWYYRKNNSGFIWVTITRCQGA